jgi:hypothetical protein
LNKIKRYKNFLLLIGVIKRENLKIQNIAMVVKKREQNIILLKVIIRVLMEINQKEKNKNKPKMRKQ